MLLFVLSQKLQGWCHTSCHWRDRACVLTRTTASSGVIIDSCLSAACPECSTPRDATLLPLSCCASQLCCCGCNRAPLSTNCLPQRQLTHAGDQAATRIDYNVHNVLLVHRWVLRSCTPEGTPLHTRSTYALAKQQHSHITVQAALPAAGHDLVTVGSRRQRRRRAAGLPTPGLPPLPLHVQNRNAAGHGQGG